MLSVHPETSATADRFMRDERGQMAFMMALSLLVVFSFIGLSFDAGQWYMVHAWSQNQADAAAQAAALELQTDATHCLVPVPPDTASRCEVEGRAWLIRNGIATPEDYACSQVIPGGGAHWFVMTDESPPGVPDGDLDHVVVCLQRRVPAAFAGLVGINTVTVSARAKATIVAGSVALVE